MDELFFGPTIPWANRPTPQSVWLVYESLTALPDRNGAECCAMSAGTHETVMVRNHITLAVRISSGCSSSIWPFSTSTAASTGTRWHARLNSILNNLRIVALPRRGGGGGH